VQCYRRWKKHLYQRWQQQEREKEMKESTRPGGRGGHDFMHGAHQMRFDHNESFKDLVTPHGMFALRKLGKITADAHTGELTVNMPLVEVMALGVDVMLRERKYVPLIFRSIIACSAVQAGQEHFWWRAVAAAYILRPNPTTLQLLDVHADSKIKESQGYCVSTYVRHGDKSSEMKLVDFSKYAETAEAIWTKKLIEVSAGESYSNDKIFWLGTEDSNVLQQAKDWGQQKGIDVRMLNLSHEIIGSRGKGQIHHMEYLSCLINLSEALKCQVFICTYLSNYCRVVDELRATVGAKANRYLADVNIEICPGPEPCIKKDHWFPVNGSVYKELDPRFW
jgi:hypothetical protein